ncbi:hypothetical protein Dxin01_03789 [Deinococcus xinjiangensis]|uniref:Uncharacterized protein n=1 Tax=Deinococcus xinjiangensis TaxID=457454 RepID=A0ABP9VH89_9DEIO
MLSGDSLRAAIEAAPLFAFQGTQYRATSLTYFRTLESSEGAWLNNNRMTPARLSRAMYLADGMDVALREATQGYQG